MTLTEWWGEQVTEILNIWAAIRISTNNSMIERLWEKRGNILE